VLVRELTYRQEPTYRQELAYRDDPPVTGHVTDGRNSSAISIGGRDSHRDGRFLRLTE
jgi:hypothetical protein